MHKSFTCKECQQEIIVRPGTITKADPSRKKLVRVTCENCGTEYHVEVPENWLVSPFAAELGDDDD